MISRLRLEGFKVFGDFQDIELAPLTLIFGANSTGKSSIIQSLLLLKQSAISSRGNDGLVFRGPQIDLGSFRNVVFEHDPNRGMIIGLDAYTREASSTGHDSTITWLFQDLSLDVAEHEDIEIGSGDSLLTFEHVSEDNTFLANARRIWDEEFERTFILEGIDEGPDPRFPLDLEFERSRPYSASIRIGLEFFDRHEQSAPVNLLPLSFLDNDNRMPTAIDEIPGELEAFTTFDRLLGNPRLPLTIISEDGRLWRLQPDTNFVRQQEPHPLERMLEKTVRGMRQELNSITHLGPLRSMPPRVQALSSGWDSSMPAEGANIVPLLAKKPRILRELNSWLSRLEIPYEISVEKINSSESLAPIGEIQCLLLTDTRTGVTSSTLDVGFGLSQVIPVVIHALLARAGSPLLIEQPEIHLHPAVQARLMDLFVSQVERSYRGQNDEIFPGRSLAGSRQFILETHSEHMILRLQKAIRLGRISPDRVAVLHVEKSPSGSSIVRRLRLNDEGEFLDEWPGGFFDERIEELFGE